MKLIKLSLIIGLAIILLSGCIYNNPLEDEENGNGVEDEPEPPKVEVHEVKAEYLDDELYNSELTIDYEITEGEGTVEFVFRDANDEIVEDATTAISVDGYEKDIIKKEYTHDFNNNGSELKVWVKPKDGSWDVQETIPIY